MKLIFGSVFLIAFGSGVPFCEAFFGNLQIVRDISRFVINKTVTLGDYLPVKLNPLAVMNTSEVIQYYGYPVEVHKVITQDGYILTMHRIPYGKRNLKMGRRQPFFLQDGILCSSAVWVMFGPGNSLAFSLADAGYDVWLGNARGTTYSRSHVKLDPNDDKFWDFSWHEMGLFDIPANIDYILRSTGYRQLFHGGFSQGSTSFYVMNSLRPQYNSKIIAHFSMAPMAYMSNMKNFLLRALSKIWRVQYWLGNQFEFHSILDRNSIWQKGSQIFCSDGAITQVLCPIGLSVFSGFNYAQENLSWWPLILGHLPAGISMKQLIHYFQETYSGHFRPFDNRPILSVDPPPPDYNLRNVVAPVYLLWGRNDLGCGEKDVERLCRELGNCKGNYPIADPNWTHVDFLFAKQMNILLHSLILKISNQYMQARLARKPMLNDQGYLQHPVAVSKNVERTSQ